MTFFRTYQVQIYNIEKEITTFLRVIFTNSSKIILFSFLTAMLDCWYSYAEPLVYLCWTFGIPMLNLWYQNALLFWYRFFNLFTDNIKARIRMKNEETKFGG